VWVSEMPPATNFCAKKTTGSRYVISPKTVTSLKIAFSIYKWKLRDRERVEKKENKMFASAVFLSCIFINLQLPQGWRASLLLTFVS